MMDVRDSALSKCFAGISRNACSDGGESSQSEHYSLKHCNITWHDDRKVDAVGTRLQNCIESHDTLHRMLTCVKATGCVV